MHSLTAFEVQVPHFKRQRAVPRVECLNSPHGLRMHSLTEKPREKHCIGSNPPQVGRRQTLVRQEEPTHADCWAKLVGRANEDQIFINGHPVTALLDTESQVTQLSQDFCLAKGIEIHTINRFMNTEGMGGEY